MTSIRRTAYPYFHAHQKITPQALEFFYSLTAAEQHTIKKHIRGDQLRLGFAVQLKVFQRLGYFPALHTIPKDIVNHIKNQISFIHEKTIFYYPHDSAVRRHRDKICEYLSVTRWGNQSRHLCSNTSSNPARPYAIQTAYAVAQTMNRPADIIAEKKSL
jgi:hypothetical protein